MNFNSRRRKDAISMIKQIVSPILKTFNGDPLFYLGRLSVLFPKKNRYKDLKNFCLFIGHGRSGSTLVGSLLNAHPNIAISNELDALSYLERGFNQFQLFWIISFISKRIARRGSLGGGGYSYHVPGQYQGLHDTIEVIGDRKAGATAMKLYDNPGILNILRKKINLRVKIIFVMRNPFDTITTTFKKVTRPSNVTEYDFLKSIIINYFKRYFATEIVRAKINKNDFLHVYHEETLKDAKNSLIKLCKFLGVKADPDYLEACSKIIKIQPHKTRMSINWPPELINFVEKNISRYPMLSSYSFLD